jgi:multidrug efflux pump subunit AcrA (membrane-fusion protein)
MNSKFSKLVLGLITTTVLIAGATSCGQAQANEQQTVTVTKGDIAVTVASDGNLSLITDRKLTFETSGKIIEVTVEEGDIVSAGQVLARLDTESLEMTIAQAELAVKAAGLDLEMATDNFKKITYPYTYYTFALGIPDSLAAIEDAERNIGYIKEKIGATITAEDLSVLQTELRAATDNLTEAREKLGRGEGADVFLSGQLPISSFWTLRDTQLTMEKAQVALDKAKNDLKKATDELDKTVITAPFDGEIVQVNVEEGDTLSQGEYASKVAFYMVDQDDLELRGTRRD